MFGVVFVVEENVVFDPAFAGLFGAAGVMFEAEGVGDTFDKLGAGLVEEFAGRFLFHEGLTFGEGGVYNLFIGF